MSTTISKTEMIIMQTLLSNSNDMYGWDIVTASEGKLKKASIYVHLSRLEKKGFIETSRLETVESDDQRLRGMRKRYYKVTATGQHAYDYHDMMRGEVSYA